MGTHKWTVGVELSL